MSASRRSFKCSALGFPDSHPEEMFLHQASKRVMRRRLHRWLPSASDLRACLEKSTSLRVAIALDLRDSLAEHMTPFDWLEKAVRNVKRAGGGAEFPKVRRSKGMRLDSAGECIRGLGTAINRIRGDSFHFSMWPFLDFFGWCVDLTFALNAGVAQRARLKEMHEVQRKWFSDLYQILMLCNALKSYKSVMGIESPELWLRSVTSLGRVYPLEKSVRYAFSMLPRSQKEQPSVIALAHELGSRTITDVETYGI